MAHGLLCEVHDLSVGEVERAYGSTLNGLVQELVEVASAERGGEVNAREIVEGLCAYSRTIPSFRASVKEWDWRDGWFVRAARKHQLATPIHHNLLRAVGQGERLSNSS